MVLKVVVPQALPGLAGAVFLGLGRAMGETIAVMLVIGGIDRIPQPWFNLFASGQSIPSKIGREAAEAPVLFQKTVSPIYLSLSKLARYRGDRLRGMNRNIPASLNDILAFLTQQVIDKLFDHSFGCSGGYKIQIAGDGEASGAHIFQGGLDDLTAFTDTDAYHIIIDPGH